MVDLLTICSFVGVLLLGVMALTIQDMRNNQPHARIKARMQQAFAITGAAAKDTGQVRHRPVQRHQERQRIQPLVGPEARAPENGGGHDAVPRIVMGAAVAGELLALAMTHFMPLPAFATPLLLMVCRCWRPCRRTAFSSSAFASAFSMRSPM